MTPIKDIIFHIGPLNWIVYASKNSSRLTLLIVKIVLPLFYLYESFSMHLTSLYQLYDIVSSKNSKYAYQDPIFGYTNSLTKITYFIFIEIFNMFYTGIEYEELAEDKRASLIGNLQRSLKYLIYALFSPFLTLEYQSKSGHIMPLITTDHSFWHILENTDHIASRFFIDKSRPFKEPMDQLICPKYGHYFYLDERNIRNNINKAIEILTPADLKNLLSIYVKNDSPPGSGLIATLKNIKLLSENLPCTLMNEFLAPYENRIKQRMTESILKLIVDNIHNKETIDLILSNNFWDTEAISKKKYDFDNNWHLELKLFSVLNILTEKLSPDEMKSFFLLNADDFNFFVRIYDIIFKKRGPVYYKEMESEFLKIMRPCLAFKNLQKEPPKPIFQNKNIYPKLKERPKKIFQFIYSKFTEIEFKNKIISLFYEGCAYLNRELFGDLQARVRKEDSEKIKGWVKEAVGELIGVCPNLEREYNKFLKDLFVITFADFSQHYDITIKHEEGPKIEFL